ncbi:acid protease, partial [Lizonia empirigonia]
PLVVQNSGKWLGNDGRWSTFYVHVGTPPQYFHVLPSFSSHSLYVPRAEDCQSLPVADCGASRGTEVSTSNSSTGFQVNATSTWQDIGLYNLAPGTNFELDGSSLYGYDKAGVSFVGRTNDSLTLEHQVVGVYSTSTEAGLSRLWLGRLGLSQSAMTLNNTDDPVSFLRALKDQGHIPSLSFGYQAGAAYRYNKVPASLILGGYDQSRRSSDIIQIPSATKFIVGVQSITASLRGGSITVLNPGVLAVLDTTVPELWLPFYICDQIASVLNLTYHEESGRYTLTDLVHNALQSLEGSLRFRLGTDIHSNPAITIEIPYKAFDLQASWPIFNSTTRYFPLRRTANRTEYTLGRVFLQEAYLVVDWERDVLELSQAVFSDPVPEPNITTIQPKPSETSAPAAQHGSTGLSTGAVAGIAIGCGLLVIGIAFSLWFWRRK